MRQKKTIGSDPKTIRYGLSAVVVASAIVLSFSLGFGGSSAESLSSAIPAALEALMGR